eukprot:gene3616-7196_t
MSYNMLNNKDAQWRKDTALIICRASIACCKHLCLRNGVRSDVESRELVEKCLEEVCALPDRSAKKDYLRDKIRRFVQYTTVDGSLKIKYEIGTYPNTLLQCCKQLFGKAYDIGHSYIDNLISEIKHEVLRDAPTMSTRTVMNDNEVQELIKETNMFGLPLLREQIQGMTIPDTQMSIRTYGWMHDHFNSIGDAQPNNNEMHLEPVHKVAHTKTFRLFWRKIFPHVKIWQFKAVTGKCMTCAKLSDGRKTQKDYKSRRLMTELHCFHRSMYMAERLAYQLRKQQAMSNPSQFMSMISDGMA